MQSPEIEDQRRGHTKIHEIGKAIEFSTESRSAFEHSRDTPIDSIQQCGEHDRRQSQVELILNCQTDRGKARTQGEESNKIWQQRANGNRLKAATKRRRRWVKRRKDH